MDCSNLDIGRMPKGNFRNWKLKRGITGIILAVPLQSNIFSFVILVLASISLNQLKWFIPALCSFVTISVYSLSMTIFFAGLHPTILFYNSKIFAQYIGTVSPLLFVFTIASILDPSIMLASPILLIPALFVLKKSYKKWDRWKPLNV